DTEILDDLQDSDDRRVSFIYRAIEILQIKLSALGSTLECRHGPPEKVFDQLFNEYNVGAVFCNHDYEPYAIQRDARINQLAEQHQAQFLSFKDHVIFERLEVSKSDGTAYTVYTPYSRKWKENVRAVDYQAYPTEKFFSGFLQQAIIPIPSIESMGFTPNMSLLPPADPAFKLIEQYNLNRDYPGREGTSRLGVHLRFGTVSIREVIRSYGHLNPTFLNELIWREFYQQILANFPSVGEGKSFKPAYDKIVWRNDEEEFNAWCNGQTGFPIVDAGIRELNATGFMHNRVRMIVASFLAKDLLIDWRWGEAYFARKLLDFDFASNNGGWQWASGSGCDAAPYFRIFNPHLQTIKFDKKFEYIRKWVPEFEETGYSRPIVDHAFARSRCLEVFGNALRQFT
ncbi:MAG TPA: deoxyribodipyrimidine photo-lyase, partial [Flavitalea sp.]|nr:deoxyribodipyrimidine photo-lyase [Flavitalea sp.]